MIGRYLAALIAEARPPSVLALRESGGRAVLQHYVSLSTPHLGARRPAHQGCWLSMWRGFSHTMVRALLDRTGAQMLLEDGGNSATKAGSRIPPSTTTTSSSPTSSSSSINITPHPHPADHPLDGGQHPPLLVEMATPGSRFHTALGMFQHRTAVNMDAHDLQVPRAGAALSWSRGHAKSPVISKCRGGSLSSCTRGGPKEGGSACSGGSHWCIAALHDCDLSMPADQVALALGLVDSTAVGSAVVAIALTQRTTNHSAGYMLPTTPPSVDSNGYISDAEQDVEFVPGMLSGLLALEWRRIELEYRPFSYMGFRKYFAHWFPIAKLQFDTKLTAEATVLLARLVVGGFGR